MSAVEPFVHPAPPSRPELPDGVEPPEDRPRWAPWTAFAALFLALITASVFGIVVYGIGGDFNDPPPAATIVATLIQDVCFLLIPLLFATLAARPRPWQFGLRRPRSLKAAAGWIVVTYLGFLIFTAIWLAILGKSNTTDDLPDQLGADNGTLAAIFTALVVCVGAPLGEEFLFRGYIFNALKNWRGLWPAAILTGLLFGGVHAGGSNVEFLLPLAVFGFGLCLLYERTGSLYPCIALHCINNSIALGSSLNWDWQIPVVLAASLTTIGAVLAVIQRLGSGAPAPAPA
jgi:uncharacterized protein